jgi:hypothetical protein
MRGVPGTVGAASHVEVAWPHERSVVPEQNLRTTAPLPTQLWIGAAVRRSNFLTRLDDPATLQWMEQRVPPASALVLLRKRGGSNHFRVQV